MPGRLTPAGSGSSEVVVNVRVGTGAFPFLLGQYEVQRPLGRGGMGTVYEAVHRHLGKRVALKTISAERLGDGDSVERFYQEMQAVGNLRHQNVVQAFDAGESDGVHYLAMELIDGVDLETLARAAPLSLADSCEIIRQAALGLHHAHEHGLVHRDVKPKNILCARDGRAVMADLGLARWQEDPNGITGTGVIMGTPDYMSPEQALGLPVDARSDVYCLGCVLYRLVSGKVPFGPPEFGSVTRKLYGHAHERPKPIADLRNDVPPELAGLVARMLAKDLTDRPQTANDVAEALTSFCAGSSVGETVRRAVPQDAAPASSSSTVRTRLATTRHASSRVTARRIALSVAAILLAGAIGAGGWLGWQALRSHAPVLGSKEPDTKRGSGKGPESVETAPPAAFEDLADSDRKPLVWYRLLNRKPEEVLLNRGQGLTDYSHNSDLRTVSVHSRGTVLLELGSTSRRSFTLQVDLYQPTWTGNVGLYFGRRVVSPEAARLQAVLLQRDQGAKRNPAVPFLFAHEELTLRPQRDGLTFIDSSGVGQPMNVALPPNNPVQLELVVEQGVPRRIRWDGQTLGGVLDAGQVVPAENCGFGIYVNGSHAFIQRAQILFYP